MSKEARPRNRAGFQFINIQMKWRVTYRGKEGKQATMLADADSRDSLFGVLRDKGINAIRVEAANDAKAAAVSIPFGKIALWGGIALASVAVGTILVLAFGGGGKESSPETKAKKKAKIVSFQPAIVTNTPVQTVEEPPRDPSIISVRKTINPFTGEEMMFTNRHKQVKANAGIISRESLANNKHKPKRKLFKHHSENYICGLMRTPLGMPIVRGRLPKNFDEDFVKSYAEEIKIEPEDTEEDIALKQAMIDFKEEIRDQIANGESVSKMVLESREEQNKLAEYRKNLMRTIADLRREGATKDELNEVRKAANVMLDKKGLKRIPEADLPRKGEEEP